MFDFGLYPGIRQYSTVFCGSPYGTDDSLEQCLQEEAKIAYSIVPMKMYVYLGCNNNSKTGKSTFKKIEEIIREKVTRI